MRILIDTNVLLDVLLNRAEFVQPAVDVLKISELQKYVSASAVTDIYYIAYRELRDKVAVKNLIKRLIHVVKVAAVSEDEILYALEVDWNDFEDSVQNAVAEFNSFDAIITRNKNDFKKSSVPIFSPQEFLETYTFKV